MSLGLFKNVINKMYLQIIYIYIYIYIYIRGFGIKSVTGVNVPLNLTQPNQTKQTWSLFFFLFKQFQFLFRCLMAYQHSWVN